jgi:hypothetical protein
MRNAAILVFANKQVRGGFGAAGAPLGDAWASRKWSGASARRQSKLCKLQPKLQPAFQPAAHPPIPSNAPGPTDATAQDGPNCFTPTEVCQHLGLPDLRARKWQVQGAVATKGQGLYEGLDWLSQSLKSMK